MLNSKYLRLIIMLTGYGLSASVLADPPGTLSNAQSHNQCNAIQEAPGVQKSTNPLCQICIGIADDLGKPYVPQNGYVMASTDTSVTLGCFNRITSPPASAGTILNQALSDWTQMCGSRGGTIQDSAIIPEGSCTPGGGCGIDAYTWKFVCKIDIQ